VSSTAERTCPEGLRRERRRAEIVAQIPSSYRHLPHLLVPSLLGLSVIALAASQLSALRPAQLLAIPLTLLASFAFEWRVHKSVLHQRMPLLGELYERHELAHHVIYQHDDMALRSPREMRLILMPTYAIVIVFLLDVPIALALGRWVSPNVGLFVLATAMSFFLSYEWLHLAYHLPEDSFIGRLSLVRRLRELHRRHHDPSLMKRWNFNVTLPLFDWVHGTVWSPERAERRRAQRLGATPANSER
jgi:hypothetical protein